MRVKVSIESQGSLEKSLRRSLNFKNEFIGELNTAGAVAVEKLAGRTPVDSGKTKRSWSKEVERNQNGIELSISNDHVTKTGIPIVALLRYGHGTGTGGYVPPNDFVTPVVNELVDDVSRLIDRKLR